MLQNIREGIQGPWAIGIVALIVISFVFTGVSGYLSSSASGVVATVNGTEITEYELEQAYSNERARIEGQFGEAANALFASESYITQFRADVLEKLIADELVSQKAQSLGLRASDQQVKDAIASMSEFAPAGVFDNEFYKSALTRAGYTPSGFAEIIREQLTRQQLSQAISASSFELDHQANTLLALQAQTRSADGIELDVSLYKDNVEVSKEDIEAYYNNNLFNFDTQEQVKLAYVSLTVDDIMPRVEVNDDEVKQYYDDNFNYFTTPAERTVSHIMIEHGDDSDAAMAKAQEVLAKVKAGEDFAELAETYSEDLLSAELGGDLGVVQVGDYEGAFGDAVLGLSEKGQTTEIVETDSGLHIIKLTNFVAEITQAFDDVKQQIVEDIKLNKATDEFFALQQEMTTLAFEQSDTLEGVAEAINKTVIETNFFQAGRLPAGLNYPQINDIAFTDDLINAGLNSDLLELSDDLVMVVRVAGHQPQRTKALEEVEAQINEQLRAEKAQQAAMTYAESIQQSIFDGADEKALLAEQALSWTRYDDLARRSPALPGEMLDSIFELSTQQGENTSVVTLANGNIGLVKLISVSQGEANNDQQQLDSLKQGLNRQNARQTFENFIQALRAQSDVVISAE